MPATFQTEPGSAHPLGVTVCKDGVNFSLFSEGATEIVWVLFDSSTATEPIHLLRTSGSVPGGAAAELLGLQHDWVLSPHSGYCVGHGSGSHVSEFRDLVKALHKAGIEVPAGPWRIAIDTFATPPAGMSETSSAAVNNRSTVQRAATWFWPVSDRHGSQK
jgi:hypothetical protein